ncbi:tail fiber domain-containing protein [Escherichia coli]|uniref:tail fiber domain-containing protein n=1 Tax=Escherichia coli TaxID=562 RepID=UPI0021B53CC6|nr:tail fiber domain-containing protein [Escherichia coli]MCT7388292.1 tail fiber domain-containing protein [Escherichia coli]
MATLKQIQFKRSKTAGARPAASVLAEGELAINLKDRTIFTKDDSGNIIDLSISAGGNISGNITQTGDYLQNGTYNLNGNQFVYAGKYIEFLPKTAGNGAWANQHKNKAPIFTDLSSTTSTSEYHPLIKQRYKDGTFSVGTLVNEGSFKIQYINESGDSKYWTFNRNGSFIVDNGSIEVRAGNISASGNINSATGFVSAPRVNTKHINLSSKTFIPNNDTGYDIVSLPTWIYNPPADGSDRDTNGLNYMRKMRASNTSSIFHEIVDCRSGKPQEISWWTGVGPSSFQWAFDTSGRITAGKSISVGLPDSGTNGRYPLDSAISIGIAIGDNDTGIKWVRDGVYDLMANGISSATILNNGINSTKKLMVGYSRDSGSTWVFPNNNQAMFTARTDVDGNNNGDGQTHIGYSSNSKMYHYFRGTGRMSVSMGDGLLVEPGILDIKTGSNSLNLRADGTIASVQTLKLNNGLYFNGDGTNASLVFKAASGVDGTKQIMWEGGTRAGQNKSYVTVKAWGNSFNASGDRNRETVFEVADGQGYYFYAQRVAPASGSTTGAVQFRVAGALLTSGGITSSGSIVTESSLVANNGLSVNGQAKFGGTADALRIWNAEYGAIFRRSETALHIIPTLKDQGENGEIGNLRPLSIALHNGMVQMRHSVTLGDDGRGGNMITVDNDSKLVVVTSHSRISPNYRMQLGQAAYIDAECTDAVRPAGAGSFASQNNENVRAPFYMNIDRTDTSTYVPILKQRYVQGNGCYSLGTLINTGNFRVHYHGGGDNGSTGPQTADFGWEFIKNGDFISPRDLIAGKVRFDRTGNITGGSGNFANLNLTLNRKVNTRMVSYSGTGGWYKLATVTMPQSTSTVTFEIAGGNGYNVNTPHQCVTSKIVLRTSNNNPKGINAVVWSMDIGQGIKNVATVNTSGDVYDIYVNVGTYAQALAVSYYATPNATINQIFASDSSGATETAVELPETAIRGQVASVLNNLAPTPNGVKRYEADSEIAINSQTGIRIRSNSDKTGSVATMLRNDGGSFYILFTDKNATDGAATVNGDWNSKRPFAINLTTGEVMMNNGIAVRSAALFYNSINVKDNGSINFDKSGANPRNMRIFHAGDASRGNRIEIADETNYIAYFEKTPGGANRFVVNNATVAGVNQMNSFGININNALGGNSIAFGDNDTGIKQSGDGILDIITNAARRMRFQSGDTYSDMNINAPNVYIRSDIRLKSNFRPIENALEKVEQLDGLIYDKADYIGGEIVQTEAGVIAQKLNEVLPEAVREVEDIKGNKILTVSSQSQIALLVEAVKTLSARVKELESKLM